MTAAFEPDDLLPAEPSPESPSEASPLPSGEPWAEGAPESGFDGSESGFDEGAEEDALADEGDHDGETVISSRAQELREQISGESEEESPAMVLALLCAERGSSVDGPLPATDHQSLGHEPRPAPGCVNHISLRLAGIVTRHDRGHPESLVLTG